MTVFCMLHTTEFNGNCFDCVHNVYNVSLISHFDGNLRFFSFPSLFHVRFSSEMASHLSSLKQMGVNLNFSTSRLTNAWYSRYFLVSQH